MSWNTPRRGILGVLGFGLRIVGCRIEGSRVCGFGLRILCVWALGLGGFRVQGLLNLPA